MSGVDTNYTPTHEDLFADGSHGSAVGRRFDDPVPFDDFDGSEPVAVDLPEETSGSDGSDEGLTTYDVRVESFGSVTWLEVTAPTEEAAIEEAIKLVGEWVKDESYWAPTWLTDQTLTENQEDGSYTISQNTRSGVVSNSATFTLTPKLPDVEIPDVELDGVLSADGADALGETVYELAKDLLFGTGGEIPTDYTVESYVEFVFELAGLGDLVGTQEWSQFLRVNGLDGDKSPGTLDELDFSMFDNKFNGEQSPDMSVLVVQAVLLHDTIKEMETSRNGVSVTVIYDDTFTAAFNTAFENLASQPGNRDLQVVLGTAAVLGVRLAIGAVLSFQFYLNLKVTREPEPQSQYPKISNAPATPAEAADKVRETGKAVGNYALAVAINLAEKGPDAAAEELWLLVQNGLPEATLEMILDALPPAQADAILASIVDSVGGTNYFEALAAGRPYSILEDMAFDRGEGTIGALDGFLATENTSPTHRHTNATLADRLASLDPATSGTILEMWAQSQISGNDDRHSAKDFADTLDLFRQLSPEAFADAITTMSDLSLGHLINRLDAVDGLGGYDELIGAILGALPVEDRITVMKNLYQTFYDTSLLNILTSSDVPPEFSAMSAEDQAETLETLRTGVVSWEFTDPATGATVEIRVSLDSKTRETDYKGVWYETGEEVEIWVNGEKVDPTTIYVGPSSDGTRIVVGIEVPDDPQDPTDSKTTYFTDFVQDPYMGPPLALLSLLTTAQEDGIYIPISTFAHDETNPAADAYLTYETLTFFEEVKSPEEAQGELEAAWDSVAALPETQEIFDEASDELLEDGVMIDGATMEALGLIPPGESDPNLIYFVPPSSGLQERFTALGLGDMTVDIVHTLPAGQRHESEVTIDWSAARFNLPPTVTHIDDFQFENTKTNSDGSKTTQRFNIRARWATVPISVLGIAVPAGGAFSFTVNQGTTNEEGNVRSLVIGAGVGPSVVASLRYGVIETPADTGGGAPAQYTKYWMIEQDVGIDFTALASAGVAQGTDPTSWSADWSSVVNTALRYRVYTTTKGNDVAGLAGLNAAWSAVYSLGKWALGGEPTLLAGWEARANFSPMIPESGLEGQQIDINGVAFAIFAVKPEDVLTNLSDLLSRIAVNGGSMTSSLVAQLYSAFMDLGGTAAEFFTSLLNAFGADQVVQPGAVAAWVAPAAPSSSQPGPGGSDGSSSSQSGDDSVFSIISQFSDGSTTVTQVGSGGAVEMTTYPPGTGPSPSPTSLVIDLGSDDSSSTGTDPLAPVPTPVVPAPVVPAPVIPATPATGGTGPETDWSGWESKGRKSIWFTTVAEVAGVTVTIIKSREEDPSIIPSDQPSSVPSDQPSTVPSDQPSTGSYGQPSTGPSGQPSTGPSGQPSTGPSNQPSTGTSNQPSDTTP